MFKVSFPQVERSGILLKTKKDSGQANSRPDGTAGMTNVTSRLQPGMLSFRNLKSIKKNKLIEEMDILGKQIRTLNLATYP